METYTELSTDSTAGAFIASDRTGCTRYSSQYKYLTFTSWIAGRKCGMAAQTAEPHPRRPAFLLAETRNASSAEAPEVRLPGCSWPNSSAASPEARRHAI
jgi:hypothetical protein